MTDPHQHQVPTSGRPITAPPSASPAEASDPDNTLDQRYHTYESNPLPWWLTVIWISFLIFGAAYLVVSLVQ